MNNFPFYQHALLELTTNEKVVLNEDLVDKYIQSFIDTLKLKVVSEGKYEFTRHGLTKFWILSQSHLIIHTWPEVCAIQIDIMTCENVISEHKLKLILDKFNLEKYRIIF